MTTGLFITIEGSEGAGKSSAIEAIKHVMRQRQRDCIYTREPGGTPFAESIRALLLHPSDAHPSAETELLLMYAARAEHLQCLIRPALAAGHNVICDRFNDSTFAYQGGGRGIPEARIKALDNWLLGTFAPDLTLLLDIPVEIGLQRARRRGSSDRIEAEQLDFFERVRRSYLRRAQDTPGRIRIIDASESPQRVATAVTDAITTLFDRTGCR